MEYSNQFTRHDEYDSKNIIKGDNYMSIANDIDAFFQRTGQPVFIEAEGKGSTIDKFINRYNSRYSTTLNAYDDGIVYLDEDKDKWGLELRCYFCDQIGFPSGVKVTSNRVYRPEYSYRFNDVDIIWELFDLGYSIGLN